MKYRQTFTVEGAGAFPFDMLRYDQCWPANESQSHLLDNDRFTRPEDYYVKPRQVALMRWVDHKSQQPTLARWQSFTWRVLDETIDAYKP